MKWVNGVAVEFGDSRVIFDPKVNDPLYPRIFISHAHGDHAKAFSFSKNKFSTKQTMELVQVVSRREINDWKAIEYDQKIKIDDVEVEAHNAGHILGSAQFEVMTAQGNVVFTGDLNFKDGLTTRAADVIPCDILVLEATFGSPSITFPPKEQVYSEIVHWAYDSIRQHKIPTFQADSIGNAQELIRVFNTRTSINVVTHWRVTSINKVYETHGHHLEYIDARSEEAAEVTSSHNCVFIAPKPIKGLLTNPDFNVAYVSGWARRFKGARKPFILSDHASFHELFDFVRECKPKLVLTCYGGRFNEVFTKIVHKNLGVKAHPLSIKAGTIPTKISDSEVRVETCLTNILRAVKFPGLAYRRKWIINELARNYHNFTIKEINEGLDILTKRGVLRYLHDENSYELR